MGNHSGYTINGPQPEASELPVRLLKSPSVRREPKLTGNNLRNLYQNPALPPNHHTSVSSVENGALGPTTPVLPPTPPHLHEEVVQEEGEDTTPVSELTKRRSMLATPVNQMSPLTPDNTPPRERPRLQNLLGAQPSMTSTRAESFKTAREDPLSDKESIASLPPSQHDLSHPSPQFPWHLMNGIYKPSPLANVPITNGESNSKKSSPLIPSSVTIPSTETLENSPEATNVSGHDPADAYVNGDENQDLVRLVRSPTKNIPEDNLPEVMSRKEGARRGRSLRERLENSRQVHRNPSIDKFASIIGWTNSVHDLADDQQRWSGVSNTSTVEAFLIETPRIPKKRNTLRHVSKNDSLRSASSPLPTSNRDSMQSSSDSPHRLLHKKVKLSNHNRKSFGSEVSREVSLGSNPAPKVDVIRVAVIPERSSSLQRMTTSSRRNSTSTAGAPTSFRLGHSPDTPRGKPTTTEPASRGRARHYPPQVPARGSSLSAPTSRNTSRANSLTSDPLRVERKRAEKDLRTTLDRMESERLASSLRSSSVETVPLMKESENSKPIVRTQDFATGVDLLPPEFITPGTKEWADLRPTSTLDTPFSQPSFLSASPEISEAKMISLHPHNNHSVQLIEPYPLSESDAVREARNLRYTKDLAFEDVDSPLRNPRRPPPPPPPLPQLHVIPATPQDEAQKRFEFPPTQNPVPLTPRRPAPRQRTDSFAKNLIRTVSLKHARNKKADQDLDSSQNPFWRPRAFWDGIEGGSPEKKLDDGAEERGMVNNSLGLTHQRLVVAGPIELARKFSERRRNRKTIAKQSSYSSLQRIRTGRKILRLPMQSMHVHFLSFKDIHEKVVASRQRREEEKREKRRDALRKSIGANVIATGDSRFPAAMVGNGTSNY